MTVIRYGGNLILDVKDRFKKNNSVADLGEITYIEYDCYKFGFAGFYKFGSQTGRVPIMLALFPDKKEAHVFHIIKEKNIPQSFLWRYIHNRLKIKEYKIITVRKNMEKLHDSKN